MKKIYSALFATLFLSILLTGCDFNLSETKYLERPDIQIKDNYFQIRGSYISSSTDSITIYRQDVKDTGRPVECVAILFPKGDEDKNNQTFYYEDERVITNREYRYYLRFTDKNGSKHRTEWSEKKKITTGASSSAYLAYSVIGHYKYDAEHMTLTRTGGTITAPDNTVITDISKYKPALVFQAGDLIQSFELPEGDLDAVNLKALLPQEFLYKDITLLGIVGQKKEYNSENANQLKSVSWTNISAITIVDLNDIVKPTIQLNPEYGQKGFDYSTTSDDE